MTDETQRFELLHDTKRNLNAGKIVFARFELLRELGSGGMGVVWLAKDLEIEGRVALKFLPGLVRDPVAERDLHDEVKNARDLVHENIVSVRTLHKDETSIAVEMEFVDGPNLNAIIANSPNRFLELAEAAPMVRGLCLAIDHAWASPRRLVHRDIKPHNLLINSAKQVKVVDFGIAHTVSETVSRLTARVTGERDRVLGTLPYMSPQQLNGEVHHSNDVYSIGATIYQMLTGAPPFRATDTVSLIKQIENNCPLPMTERRKQFAAEAGRDIKDAQPIPKLWEEAVAACLEKLPERRPVSARALALQLGLLEPPRRRVWQPMVVASGVLLAAVTVTWALNKYILGHKPTAVVSVTSSVSASPQPIVSEPEAKENNPARDAASIILPKTTRTSLRLMATAPSMVTVTGIADDKIVYRGIMNVGETQALPLETELLLEAKAPEALKLQIDDEVLPLKEVSSNRWLLTVSSLRSKAVVLEQAPPPPLPFEKEIGPLFASGRINQIESDWLRAALGGARGDREAALVRLLVESAGALTLNQWRARTSLKFKPEMAALGSADRSVRAHALDLTLPPGGVEMRLLRMEPGRFLRGSPADEIGRRPSDLPVTQTEIAKSYFIGIFEVTQSQYQSLMKRNPSYWRGNPTWPVDQVTWTDLMSSNGFFARLNSELVKQYGPRIVAGLPTEDEWEYACRAGSTTSFNNGSTILRIETDEGLDRLAQYNKADGGPRPVGSFEPNAWGLYDMHGNLQEWTLGHYVRGGSWQAKAANCRSAARAQLSRDATASNQTGFRIALHIMEGL